MSECPTRPASPGNHSATLIFLHGLGDTGDGWLEELDDICDGHIKIICPNAPVQRVTVNFGMQMPSWFDIKTLKSSTQNFEADEDEKGIIESSNGLKELIEDETKCGIPYNRVVVGGFSQGGAVGLHTFITHEEKIGGSVALSTYLPLHEKFDELTTEANKDTKCFVAHGRSDPVVPLKLGEMTRDILKTHYNNVMWNEYSGLGHSSHPTEMDDLEKFIKSVLPKTS